MRGFSFVLFFLTLGADDFYSLIVEGQFEEGDDIHMDVDGYSVDAIGKGFDGAEVYGRCREYLAFEAGG